MDGPFSMQQVPDELLDFVPKKQQQIVTNVLTSAVFGIVFSNVLSLIFGDGPSLDILSGTTKSVLPIFVLVGVASVLTTLVNNDNNNNTTKEQ